MRLPPLFLLLSCLTVSAAPFGEPTRAAFETLREALLTDANRTEPGLATAERRLHASQMLIRQTEQALLTGTDAWDVIENLTNQIQSLSPSPAVRESWQALIKTGGEEAQRTKQSVEEQGAALFSRLKTLVATATRPEDLDEIIQQLDPAVFTGRNESTPIYRKVESARSFALAWQDYLSAKAAGDQNRLTQTLSQLLNSSATSNQFIARSKLLQEQSLTGENAMPSGQISRILQQVKAPGDLPAAIEEINQLMTTFRISGNSQQSLTYIVTALQGLQRLNVEAEAGLGVRLESINSPLSQQMSFGNSEPAMIRIRELVLRSMISSFIAQATTGAIRPDESIEFYTKRALKNALAEGDLDVLARLSSFTPGLRSGMGEYGMTILDSSLRQATNQSLTSCFAARNFEAAGDPLSAVMAWHAALKSGSIYTPAVFIGDRLKSIRAAHPEAFAKAMEKALNIVSPTWPGR